MVVLETLAAIAFVAVGMWLVWVSCGAWVIRHKEISALAFLLVMCGLFAVAQFTYGGGLTGMNLHPPPPPVPTDALQQ